MNCYEVALSYSYTVGPDEQRALPCRILRANKSLGVVARNLEGALRLARMVMEVDGKDEVEIYQARLLHRVDIIEDAS